MTLTSCNSSLKIFRLCTLRALLVCVFILLISGIGKGQSDKTAMHRELEQLYDISSMPAYRTGTQMNLISTYDTTGGNDDGFSGKYSYIRKEGDFLVIADLKGPGVVNRIHTPTPTDKMLAFYFDGEKTPRLRIPFIELFSGKHFPFVEPLVGNEIGGYFSYLPLPYAKSLKIVYEGNDLRFHQIQYRTYVAGTVVQTFDSSLSAVERTALDRVRSFWNQSGVKPWEHGQATTSKKAEVKVVEKRFSVSAGEAATLFSHSQGGRILGIEIERDFPNWGSGVLLEALWDNDKLPGVSAPADDFFGYSFGRVAMQGLLMGSKDGRDYAYFPMPWDQKAVIQLRTLKSVDRNITGTARIYYSQEKRDPKREGKMYAVWRRETNPEIGKPYLIADLKGRGHYVATMLQAQGLVPGTTVFFEGDDVVMIDQSRKLQGGGSEDYFNGGWYWILDRWDRDVSLPLHGSLEYSLLHSRTGGYRYFLSDKLSFEKSLLFTIEHGPEGNKSPVDYTSVALYYGDQPPAASMDPATKQDPVQPPHVHEHYPRDFSMSIGTGTTVHFKGYGNYMEMSGVIPTRGFVVDDAERGEAKGQVRLDVSALKSGRYKLYLTYGEAPDGGLFSLWRRQQPITGWINTNADSTRDKVRVPMGEVTFTDQVKTITIRTIGDKDKNVFRLKRIVFEEIRD